MADSRPNILFICVDQWRADCLGSAGHPVVETPHLDRLAHEGITFNQAYYAQITHIDHHLNQMFQALYEFGALDNTVIVFTSDHGEMLYDHNLIAKAYPFDGSARDWFYAFSVVRGLSSVVRRRLRLSP